METEPETRLLRPGDEIRRMNGHVMELMSLLLNLAPDVITPEMVRSLAAETGFSEERCYAEYLGAVCGLDAAGRDKVLFRNYFVPMVRRLDPRPFREDPYRRSLRFPDVAEGPWRLTTLRLQPCEAFVAGDLTVMPDGRMLPRIGFFMEPYDYPAALENGREWMTLLPNETLTTEPAVAAAHGRVLTYGLGLGYFPFRAAEKPEVESVTVVERNPAAIDLFRRHLLPQFPNREKIRLIEDDAFAFAAEKAAALAPTVIFADIWHDVSDGRDMIRRFRELERFTPAARHLYWLEETVACYENEALWPAPAGAGKTKGERT